MYTLDKNTIVDTSEDDAIYLTIRDSSRVVLHMITKDKALELAQLILLRYAGVELETAIEKC